MNRRRDLRGAARGHEPLAGAHEERIIKNLAQARQRVAHGRRAAPEPLGGLGHARLHQAARRGSRSGWRRVGEMHAGPLKGMQRARQSPRRAALAGFGGCAHQRSMKLGSNPGVRTGRPNRPNRPARSHPCATARSRNCASADAIESARGARKLGQCRADTIAASAASSAGSLAPARA